MQIAPYQCFFFFLFGFIGIAQGNQQLELFIIIKKNYSDESNVREKVASDWLLHSPPLHNTEVKLART